MKRIALIVLATSLVAGPLVAQNRPPRPQQMQRMRQQVTERFLTSYVQTAALDENQQERFQVVIRQAFEWNAEHSRARRQLWQALEGQMRPGVAADVDSLNFLMDALLRSRVEEEQKRQAEVQTLREFLTPTQVAQFVIHMERFQRQVEMIRGRRGRGMGNGPPPGNR